MLVISTMHIIIAVISLIAIAGWIVSYKEYTAKVFITTQKDNEIASIHEKFVLERQESFKHYESKLDKLKEEHIIQLASYESQVQSLIQTREEELLEVEELVKNKVSEIGKAYKDVLDDQNETLEIYEKYMKNFDATIQAVDARLEVLDEKGMFNSDDEIGFFFRYVKDLQGVLNKFKIEKEELDEQQKKDQEDK